MKKFFNICIYLSLFALIHIKAYAQNGPAGIGNVVGNNGHPKSLIWVNGNSATVFADSVSTWTDLSGNLNHLGNTIFRPYYVASGLNSYPTVRFISGNNTRLVKENINSFLSTAYSAIIVYKTSSVTPDAIFSYAIPTQANEFLVYDNSNLKTYIKGNVNASEVSFQNGGAFQIATYKWRSSDGRLRLFQNGGQVYSGVFRSGDTITSGGCFAIGGEQDGVNSGYQTTEALDGEIAEIVMFSSYVNDAQRTIIENYLNLKYGITISNDLFSFAHAAYNQAFTGIGQESDGKFTSTSSSGVYFESLGSLEDGDYLMLAHSNIANAVSMTDITGPVAARWVRDWYIQQTGEQNVKITFDIPEAFPGGLYPQNINNYVLLYRNATTGNYSVANTSSVALGQPDQIVFNILGSNLPNGYYTLGTIDQVNSPVEGSSTKTWYSLASGNWSEPTIWTLDPSGSLPNNPTNSYPQFATEKVVIKTGKEVVMDLPNPTYTFASVTVDGRLDLGTKTGLTFTILRGNGRIRMAADNFPAGDATHFISAGQGEGTVVYYGAGAYSLSTPRTFYNMEVEMSSALTLMANYTINGYLRVKSGTFKISDNLSTTGLNINVYGNFDVLAGALVSTGLANARHQLNLYGDFTNAGELWFTNRVAADYNVEASNGIVDANFLNATKNQTLTCNGTSNFYRIEIDKGVDDTYELYVVANNASNFNLYGYANESHAETAQLLSNSNALGLIKGTVRIGGNINIPVLNNNGNYNISEAAQLWVDGGSVTKPSGTAIVAYGVARVSDGTLAANVGSGITFRDNGLIKVEGGTLNANQIRTSVFGASNVGGYYQSGGVANIGNASSNTDYYIFNLTYGNNSFVMSGGTLNIHQANTKGGVFINSDPGNYNVTGGTVVFDIDNSRNFVITSKAPFWNVILRNSAANTNTHILDQGVDVGADDIDLAAQTLKVLNNLTIEAQSEFNANATDVEIGGNFDLEDGAVYTTGNNTTWFTGAKNSTIYIRNAVNNGELEFYNLTINKDQHSTQSSFYTVSVDGGLRASDNFPILITKDFHVQRGDFDVNKWEVNLLGNLQITDGKFTSTDPAPGHLALKGSALQSITGSLVYSPDFGRIELENAAGAQITTNVNMDYFILTSGILNIGINRLSIDTNMVAGSGFGASKMINTTADHGAKGLRFKMDFTYTGQTVTFPVGSAGNWAKLDVVIGNIGAVTGDLTVVPVALYHPTRPSGGCDATQGYWKTHSEGFTGINSGVQYNFYSPYTVSGGGFFEYYFIDGVWNASGGATTPGTLSYVTGDLDGFPEDADFTVAKNNCFNQVNNVYSAQTGNWNTGATWVGGNVPAPYDYVVIRENHTVTVDVNNLDAGKVTVYKGGVLDINTRTGLDYNIISGGGKIRISSNTIPNGDYDNFMYNDTATFEYYGGGYVLPASLIVYPNLLITGTAAKTLPNADILVRKNLIVNNQTLNLDSGNDVYVLDSVIVSTGGTLNFPQNANPCDLTINKSIDLSRNAGSNSILIAGLGANTGNHNIYLSGNIVLNSSSVLDLYRSSTNAVNLYFNGDGNSTINSATGANLDFYRLIIDKSVNTSDVDINEDFTLNGPTSGAGVEKAIKLVKGDLTLNNSGINVNLSTGNDNFSIPSNSSLEVSAGQANVSGNSGISLDGKLIISGGTLEMSGGNNFIEYSTSGNAGIQISGGTLNVGSQVRRSVLSDLGVLHYNQSGGTANFGINAGSVSSRAIFEVLNAGTFSHTGGNFTIVNDYRSSPSIQTFYFDPTSSNFASGAILQFGNNLTVNPYDNFTIYAADSLMNVLIDNSAGTNPSLTLAVVGLVAKEDITIESGTTLNANSLNITLLGDFNNSGTYVPGVNTTFFKGVANQYINGATDLYNLSKFSANTLILGASSELNIDNNLSINDGTIDDNGNTIFVYGDINNDGITLSSGSSLGVALVGTAQQTLTGDGSFSKLTMDNTYGATIPTGNTITVTDTLRMNVGILDIGRNLFVLAINAEIKEVSPFTESNMIQTNISFTDAGIKKFFPAIPDLAPKTFIYPIGSGGKYTPVKLDISEKTNAFGSIRVKAADEIHVSVIEDAEAPNPEIVDVDNVLQYHWTLDADGIEGFSGQVTMDSYPSDVRVTPPYSVDDYITASLVDSALGTWTKYDKLDFNEATNELYFYFASTDDLGIDGDYTAGIDDAIPDQIPLYKTKEDGPWNVASTWQTYPLAGGDVPAGGPRGAIVYIEHEVSMPANFMASYITNIRSTGLLNVGTTYGHRLGIVNGTGKIYLERGDIPAGVYDGFFAKDSGTIEFSGIIDYDILSEHTYVNNLILSGTGQRRFPNLDITIYGDWTIGTTADNPEVINEHNQSITVHGDIDRNFGTFDAGFGDNAIVSLSGDEHQYIMGNFTGTNAFNHFRMNNMLGASLSISKIEIDNNLILNLGILNTSSTNTLKLNSLSDNVVTGGGNLSHINGPLFKNISSNGSFYFPVGNLGRYGRVYVKNSNLAAGYWQAQYYNQNPNVAGYDPTKFIAPLTMVSTNEYWRIQGPTGTDNGQVGLRWDGQSGMPVYNPTVINQLKVVEWRDPDSNPDDGSAADNLWQDIAGTYSINSGLGTISSDAAITFDEFTSTGNIFTLSSEATAANPVWQGDVSAAWHDPANWNTNSVPTSIDAVTINAASPNHPTISTHAVCGSLNLASGYNLTINSTASLTLYGNLTMGGNISILSDANGTGSLIDNGTISGAGTAMVQRFVSGTLAYHYISSPLSAVPNTILYNVPGEYPNPNFYAYNETVNNPDWAYGWIHANTLLPGNMRIGRGYAYAFSRNYTFDFIGGVFNTGLINSIPVTNSNHGISSDGWNLIGNPYPSALSADLFLAANTGTIDGTLYFWDDDATRGTGYSTEDYATWNMAGSVGSASSGGSKVPDGFISNGQAFFVHAHTSGNLVFNNTMRRVGNGQFFKNAPVDLTKRLRLSLANVDKTMYNQSLIVFIDGASDGFDNYYDGRKLKGNKKIAFYSLLNGEEFAIQSFKPLDLRTRPVKVVPLGFNVTVAGNYTIDLEQLENISQEMDVYLEDTKTSTFINLKTNNTYSFNTVAGVFNNRFRIHFNLKGEPENEPPFLYAPLSDIIVYEDSEIEYSVGTKTFVDIDVNDKLTYTAKQLGGQNLPNWLSFNTLTGDFLGTPENEDVGRLYIQITATDKSGAIANDDFVLEVENTNDAPMLNGQIPDQETFINMPYNYSLTDNLFLDEDVDDEIQLSAKLANGQALPQWLQFNGNQKTFAGTPLIVEDLQISVFATDKSGATASSEFTLSVKSTTGIDDFAESSVKVFPNPTRGQFNVYSSAIPGNITVLIRDNSGRLIQEQKLTNSTTPFDLKGHEAGNYFIELTDGVESKVFKLILHK